VNLLIVIVDWVSRRRLDKDAVACVYDESGEIRAHIHESIMEEYSDIRHGSVMVLKRIAILDIDEKERCLNVHPNNVVTILPPETKRRTTPSLINSLSKEWIQRWIQLGREVPDLFDWQKQVEAAAIRDMNDLQIALNALKSQRAQCTDQQLFKQFDLGIDLCQNALDLRKSNFSNNDHSSIGIHTCCCGHASFANTMCLQCGRHLNAAHETSSERIRQVDTVMTDTFIPLPQQPTNLLQSPSRYKPHHVASHLDKDSSIMLALSPLPRQAEQLLLLLLLWNQQQKKKKQGDNCYYTC